MGASIGMGRTIARFAGIGNTRRGMGPCRADGPARGRGMGNGASVPGGPSVLWHTIQGIRNFRPLFGKKFPAGRYTIEIISPDPSKFTFAIKDIPAKRPLRPSLAYIATHPTRPRVDTIETTVTLTARVSEKGLSLTIPDEYYNSRRYPPFDSMDENVSGEWHVGNVAPKWEGGPMPGPGGFAAETYSVSGLNLRIITEALLEVLAGTQALT